MRKIFFFIISLMAGLIIFGFATSRVGFEEIGEAFDLFPSQGLILILILTFLITLVSIWRLKFILRTYGYDLSFSKLGEIWTAGFAISYLTPIAVLGGEVFIIYALRKELSLSWEKSIASAFVNKILDATIFLPFLILGLFIFPALSGFFPVDKVIIAGGGVAAIFATLLAVFYLRSFRKKSVLEFILKFFGMNKKRIEEKKGGKMAFEAEKEVLKFFGLKKKEMWEGIGLAVLKYLLILVRCWLLIFFFQGGISILKAISAYGFYNLACLIPIPAMLGSLEVAESLVFEGLGLGANVGIAFSLLLRAMDVLVVLAGIILLIKFGTKLAKMKIIELVDKIASSKNSLFIS